MATASPDLPQLPARDPQSHKGDFGRVLVVAGSVGMAGAAALVVQGAFRSGVGYVELACPESLVPAYTQAVPEAILHLCRQNERGQITASSLPALLEWAQGVQSLVLGPGLGCHQQNLWVSEFLQMLCAQQPQLPFVVDADALNHLALQPDTGIKLGPHGILSPHPGEAARLLGWSEAKQVQQQRRRAAELLAQQSGATVILKGAGTLVARTDKETWCNLSGNAGMATAGSGDVLSGHLGALLALGLSPWDAARLGVYLHGRAGDLFVQQWGADGLLASDLALWLSKAMTEWRQYSC